MDEDDLPPQKWKPSEGTFGGTLGRTLGLFFIIAAFFLIAALVLYLVMRWQ